MWDGYTIKHGHYLDHPLDGKKAIINNLAPKHLRGKKVIIKHVYLVNNQNAIVDVGQLIPFNMIYIEDHDQMIDENIIFSWQSRRAKAAVEEFQNKTYNSPNGIEKLCWVLTHVETHIAIRRENNKFILSCRARPFSKYDKSLVITEIHLNICYLNKSTYQMMIYITDRITPITSYITHPDPWVRSMMWFEEISYNPQISKRIRWAEFMHKEMREVQKNILIAAEKLNSPLLQTEFPYITILINSWGLKTGTIGKYGHPLYMEDDPNAKYDYENIPSTTLRFYGEFTIHESIFVNILKTGKVMTDQGRPLFKYVVAHEMIHAIFKEKCTDSNHGPLFKKIANSIDLPEKYWK
jgi:hypothetical protein